MGSLSYRELYAPGHFGNSYEVMAPYEMEQVLREAVRWGFNAYGDWLDSADLKNPRNNPRDEYLLPQAIWEKKLRFYRIAARLGLVTDFVITPNHVFLDQLRRDLLAQTEGEDKIFGQLLCPSKPEAREIILENQRQSFEDLRAAGVVLDSISSCPYDYGGCACESCSPWIITWGKLFADIHDLAKGFFPDVKARLIGWWWTPEEHATFKEWADAEQPGRFESLAAHLPYGATRPDPSITLPAGCELHAFVHIGYGNLAHPRDPYGTWGPVAAPERIERTVRELRSAGATGVVAYSEGVHDDVNKAVLGWLASDAFQDRMSVLCAYAEDYFGAEGADRDAWARWLERWGRPFEVDVVEARAEFDRLARNARAGWRLEQWACRLRLFEAHGAAAAGKRWGARRKAAARRFFEERDMLYREVWKLGLPRHVLNPRFFEPEWAKERESRAGPALEEM